MGGGQHAESKVEEEGKKKWLKLVCIWDQDKATVIECKEKRTWTRALGVTFLTREREAERERERERVVKVFNKLHYTTTREEAQTS